MKFLTSVILSMPLIGAYALFAVGIVVIYRASRVLNLAHGAMAMVPAYVAFSMSKAGIPVAFSLILGVATGMVLGIIVERVFVRGLRQTGTTGQTVGTVAVLSLLIAITAIVWGSAPQKAPAIFPEGSISVGAGILQYGAIGLFVVAGMVSAAMLALFRYTGLGLAMRGAADNRRAASLMGIDPDRTTMIAWSIGGGLAALSGILLAGITTLDPYELPLQVLPAFVAALLGGIESVTGAITGAAIVGLLIGLVPATSNIPIIKNITGQTGGVELTLTIAALVVMYLRGQRFSVAQREDSAFAGSRTALKEGRRRKMPRPLAWGLFAGLALWVWIPGVPFSIMANSSLAMAYAVVGVSLVLLTGWVGQISLGHAALVGVGAFGTGILSRELGIPFPFNLPLAALLAAGVATLLGAVALRVRGLYLAVATLIFSWMADSFLFQAPWFVGKGGSSTIPNTQIGVPGGFPNFDFQDRKTLYYFGLAITALALLAAANVRNSKTGRAFFATRGSEMAAASLGINVMRYKLLSFALSGMLAGAAGNLIMIDQLSIVPDDFRFTISLFYLSIAVVGGLRSLGGIVFSAALFAGLNEVFFRVAALQGKLELVSALLLVFALLVQAKGDAMGAAWAWVRERLRPATVPLRRILAPAGRAASSAGVAAAALAAPLRRGVRRAQDRVRAATQVDAGEAKAHGSEEAGTQPIPEAAAEATLALADDAVMSVTAAEQVADGTGAADSGGIDRSQPTRSLAAAVAGERVSATLRSARAGFSRARDSVREARGRVTRRASEAVRRFLPGGGKKQEVLRGGGVSLENLGLDLNKRRELPEFDRTEAPAVLEGEHVTVRFGGLVAVNNASLQVRRGEIVGLIGPNGAGKTTMFNALSGLNEPTHGGVRLFGEDVSPLPVHERARRGMARTFQVLQLFSDLTVRENLLVATHSANETGVVKHILATDDALRAEREAHQRVDEVIDALDLHEIVDRPAAGLPFGLLRLVELGRAVVTKAPIVLLDEPASGLDNTETERFAEFLKSLRDRLGITMLLIEHDVKMVTGVSDYMYVLNMGQMISEGPPEFIKRDPIVIAAYLGESDDDKQQPAPEPATVGA